MKKFDKTKGGADYDKKIYEKELKNFLPKEFIDCHIHVWEKDFPSQGKSNGGSTWTSKVCSDTDVESLLESYKIMFPENKVTPLVFGSCSRHIPTCNEYVRTKSEKYGFPTLFRTSYDMTPDYLEEFEDDFDDDFDDDFFEDEEEDDLLDDSIDDDLQ